MENVKAELLMRVQDVFDDVKMSSTLLESGKEIFAHRQLQGVRSKLVNLIEWVSKGYPEENVVTETPQVQ